jgi:hypothetical protein
VKWDSDGENESSAVDWACDMAQATFALRPAAQSDL